MTEQVTKLLPAVTDTTRPFWEAARNHDLLLLKCVDCAHFRNPLAIDANICPNCGSRNPADWVKASGRGKLYTWSVVHRAYHPSFEAPYAIVIVELEEGPRFMANMRDIPPDQLEAEMPLEVIFEDVSDEMAIPQFRPAK